MARWPKGHKIGPVYPSRSTVVGDSVVIDIDLNSELLGFAYCHNPPWRYRLQAPFQTGLLSYQVYIDRQPVANYGKSPRSNIMPAEMFFENDEYVFFGQRF